MPSPKARFVGDGHGEPVPGFSKADALDLRRTLLHHGAPKANAAETGAARDLAAGFGNEQWQTVEVVDEVVDSLHAEAYRVKVERAAIQRAMKKPDLLKTQATLLARLEQLGPALRALPLEISTRLRSCLPPDTLADQIDAMAASVSKMDESLRRLPSAPRRVERDHTMAVRLARGLAKVFNHFDIPVTATYAEKGSASLAVKTLNILGAQCGIRLHLRTWRNTLLKVPASERRRGAGRKQSRKTTLKAGR